jgi:UMF1 family MFS transporter
MSTSSFAMYTFSVAVMVQAITLLCTSSFADYGMFHNPSRRFQILIPISPMKSIFTSPSLSIHEKVGADTTQGRIVRKCY